MHKMTILPNGLRIVTDEMLSVDQPHWRLGGDRRAETREIGWAAISLNIWPLRGLKHALRDVLPKKLKMLVA